MNPKKLLLVGGNYLGEDLMPRLRSEQFKLSWLRRHPRPPLSKIEGLALDVRETKALSTLSEFDIIITALTAEKREAKAYRSTFIEGAKSICQRWPDAHHIFLSSTSVYGEKDGETIDDSTLAAPTTPTGVALLEAENIFLQLKNSTILRPSGIYGPERTRFLQSLSAPLPESSKTTWTNRIHRTDLNRMIERLVSQPALPRPRHIIASDPQPAPILKMQEWYLSQRPEHRSQVEAESQTDGPNPDRAKQKRASGRKNRKIEPRWWLEQGFTWAYPSFREGYAAEL
ncbi:MAG: hypothetical protein MK135_11985 [Polyangiaceae bacterium]|nr:hypothetical protein [Polyangiaceae bacterium]